MTVWDCICNSIGSPTVSDIMDMIQRNTVCTGTQCFETQQDAFGIVALDQGLCDTSYIFTLLFLVGLLVAFAPPSITSHKPLAVNFNSREPDL